jgi:leader peptidase (prepilin peptidase)/N-methyltransferase
LVGCSACEVRGAVLTPRDLVPVLSYAAISIASMSLLLIDEPAEAWCSCLLGCVMLDLAWIDWDAGILPDVFTLPMVLVGLAVVLWLEPGLLAGHAAAAVIGDLAFRLIRWLYSRLRNLEGLGESDAKLMAATHLSLGAGL